MNRHCGRRAILKITSALAAGVPANMLVPGAGAPGHGAPPSPAVRVVVWDERQPEQKQAYANFLGNQIAGHLQRQPGISAESVGLDEPGQGLAGGVLDRCDVLIWWGHVRNREIAPEVGQSIVARIKAGSLALIALHSAHWSTPFVEAMFERARMDADNVIRNSGNTRFEVVYRPPPDRYTVPKVGERLSPSITWRKYPDGRAVATVQLPYCCFPAYRTDGKPSQVRVLAPHHPIAAGIPGEFNVPSTEMYDEPFHVPAPDEVIFEERWRTGEWFRSGAVWKIGQGRVFYFRPGHETYPVYEQELPLKVLTNAVYWLAAR